MTIPTAATGSSRSSLRPAWHTTRTRRSGPPETSGGDCSEVHSVASFFVSRVDTEVDRRLDAIDTAASRALRGQAAIAQARLAYQLFVDRFGDDRWQLLAARGARVQRPLWAST